MNRLRAIALAATLALHAWVLWLVLAEPPPSDSSRPATSVRPRHDRKSPRPSLQLNGPTGASINAPRYSGSPRPQPGPTTPTAPVSTEHDAAWHQAYAAGRAMEARRQEWVTRTYRRLYGDDIAALMELPMPDSWPRLEALALEGDKTAAEALRQLSVNCLTQPSASPDPAMVNSLVRGRDPLDAAFIQGAYQAEFETQQRLRAQCEGPGLGYSRLRDLVETRLGAIPAERDLRQQGWTDWYVISEAFRQTFGGEDATTPTDPMEELGSRLSAPDAAPSQTDVEALLAAVGQDPRALEILVFCFIHGCNGIDPLPPAERLSWSLRAARSGGYHGMHDVIEQTRASDPLTAYQWTGFERELMVAGCDPMPNAGMLSVLLQTRAQIGAGLTPSERALGDQRTRELMARYGDQAMAIQHCAAAH